MNEGVEKIAGLRSTRPIVAENSAFCAGFGETALAGPLRRFVSSAKRMMPTISSKVTQEIH